MLSFHARRFAPRGGAERRLEGLRSAPRALRPIRFVSNTLTLNPYRTARALAQRVDRSNSHGTDAAALVTFTSAVFKPRKISSDGLRSRLLVT